MIMIHGYKEFLLFPPDQKNFLYYEPVSQERPKFMSMRKLDEFVCEPDDTCKYMAERAESI